MWTAGARRPPISSDTPSRRRANTAEEITAAKTRVKDKGSRYWLRSDFASQIHEDAADLVDRGSALGFDVTDDKFADALVTYAPHYSAMHYTSQVSMGQNVRGIYDSSKSKGQGGPLS